MKTEPNLMDRSKSRARNCVVRLFKKLLLCHHSDNWSLLYIAVLALFIVWYYTEEQRIDERFATGIQVDTVYAEVVNRKYFKNAYTYKVQFKVNSGIILVKLQDHSVPDLKVGWRIPLAYLEDDVDKIRFLPYSRVKIEPRRNSYGSPVIIDTTVIFSPKELWTEVWIENKYNLDEVASRDTFYEGKQIISITGKTREGYVVTERLLLHKEYNAIESW